MNIVLIGFRGSGKSTVGRALARHLGWSFVDTDELVEQRVEMTIRDIFTDYAEDAFRDLESQVVAEVAHLDNCVIGTGGGVVLSRENIEVLHQSGQVVYLTASPEVLWERIVQDTQRLATRLQADPDAGLRQLRESITVREPLYYHAANCVVETEGRTISNIVEQILANVDLPCD